jgi:hypothetical protein
MGAKYKSKTHLQNRFFDFLSRFLRVWLKSFQKVLIWLKTIFLIKKDIKNAEFHADFESAEKVVKNSPFLLITFFGAFFQNLFNGFEISVKFCVFLFPYWIFEWKKKFWALICTFCKLWLQMRTKGLKKTENLFLWMCLIIYLGNLQRVCITKLLSSLYPNMHTVWTNVHNIPA